MTTRLTKTVLGLMVLAISLLLFNACKDNVSVDLENSLRVFSELNPIEGAASTNMTVNKGNRVGGTGYFQVEIEGAGTNAFLKDGVHEAWCLEWRKPMRSSNDLHQDVKWYSSIGNSKWRPLNYFFSIRNELKIDDPGLNTMEIQAVVWSLTGYMGVGPEFDIQTLENSQLPSDWFEGGTPKFSKEKVHSIVSRVLSEYKSPQFKTSGNPGTAMMSVGEGGCVVGETDPDQQNVCIPVDPDPDVEIVLASITAGENFSCSLDINGNAYCWGYNNYGQLGDGTSIQRLSPSAVSMPTGVRFSYISAGSNHTVALATDGRGWAWGRNGSGQIGDGTLTQKLIPVAISMPAGLSYSYISAGGSHTTALSTDGSGWAWGSNSYGQLGDGSVFTNKLTPVLVTMPPDVSFKSISAGSSYTVALSTNGQGWAWGLNSRGQLGDGTTTHRLTPVAISMPSGVSFKSISAGSSNTVALSTNGQGWTWGSNIYGQLGDGTTTDKLSPVAVTMPAGVNFSYISAGAFHITALATDGQGWIWGANFFGQLGDGTTINKLTPITVSMPADVIFNSISAGYAHTTALTTNGQGWAWGDNHFGRLGDGTTNQRLTPVALVWP